MPHTDTPQSESTGYDTHPDPTSDGGYNRRSTFYMSNMDANISIHSFSSFSTMATMDDNPGTGRALDKYVIQPLAKKLERRVGRAFGTHFVPGHRIGQKLQELFVEYRGVGTSDRIGLEGAIIKGFNRLLFDFKYVRRSLEPQGNKSLIFMT